MIRVSALLVLLAASAQAQDAILDRNVVAACFDQTDIGQTSPACIGTAADACMEKTQGGYSTAGMVSCVAAETAIWDEFLNLSYRDLRANMRELDADALGGDISRADALRDAQRAWIAFRDAECAFNWAIFQDGTMRSLVSSGCFLDMTARRTFELRNQTEMPG